MKFLLNTIRGLGMIILSIILMASALVHHPLDKLGQKVIINLQATGSLWLTGLLLLALLLITILGFVPKWVNKGSYYLLSRIKFH